MIFLSLERKVLKAQNDSELTGKLIAAHEGFIRKCMIDQQKASGPRFDDEMTVAMLAFSEAIAKYDESRGNFLSFARLVITRRMVDEYRRQLRQIPEGTRSMDESYFEEEDSNRPYETQASVANFENEVKRADLQMEIALYNEGLGHFNLSFASLAEISPKQERLRDEYREIAKWLAEQPNLLSRLYKDKKLPVTEILSHCKTDRKHLERGRGYIIALIVLMNSDLEMIKSYLERR